MVYPYNGISVKRMIDNLSGVEGTHVLEIIQKCKDQK